MPGGWPFVVMVMAIIVPCVEKRAVQFAASLVELVANEKLQSADDYGRSAVAAQ